MVIKFEYEKKKKQVNVVLSYYQLAFSPVAVGCKAYNSEITAINSNSIRATNIFSINVAINSRNIRRNYNFNYAKQLAVRRLRRVQNVLFFGRRERAIREIKYPLCFV